MVMPLQSFIMKFLTHADGTIIHLSSQGIPAAIALQQHAARHLLQAISLLPSTRRWAYTFDRRAQPRLAARDDERYSSDTLPRRERCAA